MKRGFFLLLLFLSASASAAGPVRWEPAGWDGGGCFPNVSFDPNLKDRVYLTSDVAGLWRSDDLGENWRFMTKGLGHLNVPLLAVAPSDSNVLYAGTGGGLYVSRDAGENWTVSGGDGAKFTFARPENHRSILISRSDAAVLVAGTSDGQVRFSRDHGAHWDASGIRPLNTRSAITALAWADSEGSVYASSADGLAKFSAASGKWEVYPNSPKSITDFLFHPVSKKIYTAGQKNLQVSSDGGVTWSASGQAPEGILFRFAYLDEKTGEFLAAWTDDWKGGVLSSMDHGVTWTEHGEKLEPDLARDPTRAWANLGGAVNALKASPFDAHLLFRTDWWGVWRSQDGGLTWQEKINGAPNTVTSDVFVTKEGRLLVATMDNGLLESADGGKTYRTLFPRNEYRKDENGHVWRVTENAAGGWLATSSPWNESSTRVIASRDKGETFEKSDEGLPKMRPRKNTVWQNGYAKALAAHPTDPNTVYLGIDGDDGGGFFVSMDGARTWQKTDSQPGSLKIYNGLALDPKDPKRIFWGASGKKGGIYLSEDGGKSWRYVFSKLKKVFDVAVAPDGTVYAAGDRGGPVLFASKDGGKKWDLVKRFEGSGSVEALCPLPDGRMALGVTRWNGFAPGHLYLGSKGLSVWDSLDGDLPPGEGPASLAYDPKTKTLYMARYAGSVYKTRLDMV